MELKKELVLIAMGVGGTLLYQQMRNGNVKRYLNDVTRMAKRTCDDLEDMM